MSSFREQLRESLIQILVRMGYPAELGQLIADSLGTEKQMSRMVSYLIQFKPGSAEEIVDEMLAIQAEFARYREKKIAEYYNGKYNQLLSNGPLDED